MNTEPTCPLCGGIHYSKQNAKRCAIRHGMITDMILPGGKKEPNILVSMHEKGSAEYQKQMDEWKAILGAGKQGKEFGQFGA